MTLSDSYRKAMDRVVLSDDIKERIVKNAVQTKSNRRYKSVGLAKGISIAACFVIAVFSVFVMTDKHDIPEKKPVEIIYSENSASGKKVTNDSAQTEIKNMESFAELEVALEYEIKKPSFVPDGYMECSWTLISESIAEILYIGNGDIMTYRTSKTDALTDEGVYEVSETVMASDIAIKLKGNSEKYYSAEWKKNGENFVITSIYGLERNTLVKIAESVV